MVLAVSFIFDTDVKGYNNNVQKCKRDIVLMLDVSDSMNGQPLEVMKQSAIKFFERVKESNSSTNIKTSLGLVIYDYYHESYDVTEDIDSLEEVIKGICLGSGTDMKSAFDEAVSLFDKDTNEDSIKSIVLMTDGLPLHGFYCNEGPYKKEDNEKAYAYANTMYSTVKPLFNKYNIYTLGFFHSLKGNNLDFAKKFLNDIQNTGYYEVTDSKKFEMTFGEIAENITADQTKCPIIIVPGMNGSKLYEDKECTKKVWDLGLGTVLNNDKNSLKDLENKIKDGQRLYVDNKYEDEVKAVNKEYGANNNYKKLVNKLCDECKDREVYFFSYDFRESSRDNSNNLNEMINKVMGKKWEKVDLVCHDMGGLIASSYVSNYGSKKIDSVITLGTAYEGIPEIINNVLGYNTFQDIYKDNEKWISYNKLKCQDGFKSMEGLGRDVKSGFMSVSECIPCEESFNKKITKMNYKDYQSVCLRIFGSKLKKSEGFQSFIKVNGINVLQQLDNSYFAVGINKPTIKSVVVNSGNTLGNIECNDLLYEFKGDGTVPYYSSTMLNNLPYMRNASERYIELNLSNGELIKNNESLQWVINILNKNNRTNISNIKGDTLESTKYIVVKLCTTGDVSVKDNNEVLSSDKYNFNNSTSFGRLDILGKDDNIKMLCLRDDKSYKVSLNCIVPEKITYSVRWYSDDDKLIDEKIYKNVEVTDSSIINTALSKIKNTVTATDTIKENTSTDTVNKHKVNVGENNTKDSSRIFILIEVMILSLGVVLATRSKVQETSNKR